MNRPGRKRLIAAILLVTLTTGCGGSSSPARKVQPENQPPKQLNQMKDDILKLQELLDTRLAREASRTALKGAALDMAKQGKQSTSAREQSDKSQSPAAQGKGKEKTSAQDVWSEEAKIVTRLHNLWNGLEPQAIARGLTPSTQEAMEESLAQLTRQVEARKAVESALAANQVYRYYAEITALFPVKIPPDLERLHYHITEARLRSETREWVLSQKEAARSLEIWKRVSMRLSRIPRSMLYQTEHSISDLAQAANQKSTLLTDIKASIAIRNLERIKKKLEAQPAT